MKNNKDSGGIAGTIIKNRTPDQPEQPDQDSDSYSLTDCAQEVMDALQSGDPQQFADAMKEFMSMAQSEPDESEDQTSPHTYDAQSGAE